MSRAARRSRRDGFTAIELIIAVALGALIIVVVAQAFRVATQCATTGRRLSIENSLMRAGFARAHEQRDFWTDLDDPEDPARQPMRAVSGADGLPFTRFRDVMTFAAGSPADPDHRRGWEPGYHWPANDPRGWWRGNLVESAIGDLRFGRYVLFSATEPRVDVVTDPALTPTVYGTGVDVAYTWLPDQYHDLLRALQVYGAVDYLPANAIYGFYGPWRGAGGWSLDGATGPGGIPHLLGHCNSDLVNSDGGQLTVRGLWRLTQGSGYGISRPDLPSNPGPAQLVADNSHLWYIGWSANVDQMRDFIAHAQVPAAVAPLLPAHWPRADVSTTRYIKSRRFVAMATLRWRSPVTGETASMYCAGYGTSLRGARQQRHRDQGWARWDDSARAANDPTLDQP